MFLKVKKGWTQKACSLCKNHGGMHTTHNTKECMHYNEDWSHRKAGGTPKPNKPASGKDGMNFAQLIRNETKKAVRYALEKVNTKRVIVILTPTTEVLGQIAQVVYVL